MSMNVIQLKPHMVMCVEGRRACYSYRPLVTLAESDETYHEYGMRGICSVIYSLCFCCLSRSFL